MKLNHKWLQLKRLFGLKTKTKQIASMKTSAKDKRCDPTAVMTSSRGLQGNTRKLQTLRHRHISRLRVGQLEKKNV